MIDSQYSEAWLIEVLKMQMFCCKIFFNSMFYILIEISLKFAAEDPINIKPVLI